MRILLPTPLGFLGDSLLDFISSYQSSFLLLMRILIECFCSSSRKTLPFPWFLVNGFFLLLQSFLCGLIFQFFFLVHFFGRSIPIVFLLGIAEIGRWYIVFWVVSDSFSAWSLCGFCYFVIGKAFFERERVIAVINVLNLKDRFIGLELAW